MRLSTTNRPVYFSEARKGTDSIFFENLHPKPFTGGKFSSFGDSFGSFDYFRLPVLAASGAGGVLAASGAGGTLAASGAGGTLGEAWPG